MYKIYSDTSASYKNCKISKIYNNVNASVLYVQMIMEKNLIQYDYMIWDKCFVISKLLIDQGWI